MELFKLTKVETQRLKTCSTCHHIRGTSAFHHTQWRCASPKNVIPNSFDTVSGKCVELFSTAREARCNEAGCGLLGDWHQTTAQYLANSLPKLDTVAPITRRRGYSVEDLR